MKNRTFSYLSSQKIIISVFLGVYVIGIIGFILFGENAKNQNFTYYQLLMLKFLSLLTYGIIFYFAYKGVKCARWLMALIIFFSGVQALIIGLLGTEWGQYLFKPLSVIVGIYFIYAGIVTFRIQQPGFLTFARMGRQTPRRP